MTTGWNVTVPLEPGKKIRAITTWKEANLDVPFTYDLIYWDGDGQEVCRQGQTGQLHGVSGFGLTHNFETL